MKKFMNLAAALFIGAVVTLSSCGKYEDGPSFSLRSKKARISRTWVPEKYIDGSTGTEVAAGANDGKVEIKKDGTFTQTFSGGSFSGTWEFTSDKTGISTTVSVGGLSTTTTSTILRLTSKEFWLKDTDGDKTYFKAE